MSKLFSKSFAQYLGWAALTFLVFAFVAYLSLDFYTYNLVPLHLALAAGCFGAFLFFGGRENLATDSSKRRLGFSLTLFAYGSLFFAVLVAVNYLGAKHQLFRYDSTQQKVFSLAEQTQKVLGSLNKPVLIRAFYLGGVIPETSVKALLALLDKSSNKLSFEVIDPDKRPLLADQFGISENATLHFSYQDENLDRQTRVVREVSEQTIVNALLKLERAEGKTVYYLTGHGQPSLSEQVGTAYLYLMEAIAGENINLKKLLLSGDSKIPADASAIILASPDKALLKKEKQQILTYLKKGGSAVFLNDPGLDSPKDIADLSSEWGIATGGDVIVEPVLRVLAGPGLGVQPKVVSYGEHPITKTFNQPTVFDIATSVRAKKQNSLEGKVTEFAFSSDRSWAETNTAQVFGQEAEAVQDENDLKGPVSLAAAYQDKKTRLVVFGDGDFVTNANIRQLYNRDLFLNALNWTIGEADQLSIRPRTLRNSLTGITDQQFGMMFIVTVILIPEILILFGFFVWWSRNRS